MQQNAPFTGYPPPTSSTTYTPNQFFDVVLPNSSRGVVRIVGYMLRRILGWSDADGNPKEPQVSFSYSELIEKAGVSRPRIKEALDEAIAMNFVRCVVEPRQKLLGQSAVSGVYELCWSDEDRYVRKISEFRGFFSGNGNLTYIPNKFFDYTLREEPLSVVKVVGAIIRHTIGFQSKFGFRRQQVEVSFSHLARLTGISSTRILFEAVQVALEKNHIVKVREGAFVPGRASESSASIYSIKWQDGVTSSEPGRKKELSRDPEKFFALSGSDSNGEGSGSKGERASAHQGVLVSGSVGLKRGTSPSGTVTKGERNELDGRLQKENENGSKKRTRTVPNGEPERLQKENDIEITPEITLLNNSNESAVDDASFEKMIERYERLVAAGFDAPAAKALAAQYPAERIRRQLELLPKRRPTKNPLGFLRKAIEEDWPPPPESMAGTDQARRPERRSARNIGQAEVDPEYEQFCLPEAFRLRENQPELWEAFLAEDCEQREKLRSSARLTGVSAERVLESFDSPTGQERRFTEYLLRLGRIPSPRAFAAGKAKRANE